MQHRNYAALFAALVIGFVAVHAHAADIRSVTVAKPDTGETLAIGDEFRVVAVVRDFSPSDDDGIHFALVTRGGDPVVSTAVPGPDGGGAAFPSGVGVTEYFSADPSGVPTVNSVSASVLRNVGDLQGEGPRAIQNELGAVVGTDSVRITVVNNEFITYTWWGTIRVRMADPDGGLVEGIRAVAVAVDGGIFSPAVVSGDAVQFAADADRPTSPADLTAVAGIKLSNAAETSDPILGLGAVDTTRGYIRGIPTSNGLSDFAAGIGDTIKFNIDITEQLLKVVDGGHKLALGISNARSGPDQTEAQGGAKGFADLKYWDEISLVGRNLTELIQFRYVIQEGDFGNLVGQADQAVRNVATAYLVDPAGNRSPNPAADAATNGPDTW